MKIMRSTMQLLALIGLLEIASAAVWACRKPAEYGYRNSHQAAWELWKKVKDFSRTKKKLRSKTADPFVKLFDVVAEVKDWASQSNGRRVGYGKTKKPLEREFTAFLVEFHRFSLRLVRGCDKTTEDSVKEIGALLGDLMRRIKLPKKKTPSASTRVETINGKEHKVQNCKTRRWTSALSSGWCEKELPLHKLEHNLKYLKKGERVKLRSDHKSLRKGTVVTVGKINGTQVQLDWKGYKYYSVPKSDLIPMCPNSSSSYCKSCRETICDSHATSHKFSVEGNQVKRRVCRECGNVNKPSRCGKFETYEYNPFIDCIQDLD